MGNSHSSSNGHHHRSHRKSSSSISPAALKAFNNISGGRSHLSREDFEHAFGNKIGDLLWTHVFDEPDNVDQKHFAEKYYELSDMRSEQCVKLFSTIEEFLDACLSTADKSLKDEDHEFVEALLKDIDSEGGARYFTSHCPGLALYTVIRKIKNVVCPSSEQIIFTMDSAILSPLKMLLTQGSMPEMVYFQNKQASKPCWTKLYDSNVHGLSTNVFEGKVFGYTSPTVSIFKLSSEETYAIAMNTEWRHTTKFLGSSLSKCLQLAPHFKPIESRHQEPVFCNFKFRTSALGLGFRDVFKIDGDFSNVLATEVWGCGSDSSLQEQQTLKMRQKMQAERNQKVPLPGNWDENPDKVIMEMHGFQFSNERNRPQPPHEDE